MIRLASCASVNCVTADSSLPRRIWERSLSLPPRASLIARSSRVFAACFLACFTRSPNSALVSTSRLN